MNVEALVFGENRTDQSFEVPENRRSDPLRECVRSALQGYFSQLGGHKPNGLYQMVMEEVESPLLETVMEYTRGNQTKAAAVLGISRSTLRKKLAQYDLEN